MRLAQVDERTVVSIAIGLEATRSRAPELQPDLFGGPIELPATPYGSYYAELARRICVRAHGRRVQQ